MQIIASFQMSKIRGVGMSKNVIVKKNECLLLSKSLLLSRKKQELLASSVALRVQVLEVLPGNGAAYSSTCRDHA